MAASILSIVYFKENKEFLFKKKNVILKCEMNTESKYNVMSVRNVVK